MIFFDCGKTKFETEVKDVGAMKFMKTYLNDLSFYSRTSRVSSFWVVMKTVSGLVFIMIIIETFLKKVLVVA